MYVYHVGAIRNIRGLHDSVMLDMAHLCFLDNIMITVMKNSTISLTVFNIYCLLHTNRQYRCTSAVEINPLKYNNQSIWVKSKKVLIEDPYAEKIPKNILS